MPIDYAAMRVEYPKLKAALTRAKNTEDPVKVLDAVEKAFDRFDAIGWPDGWHTWHIALQDAWYALGRSGKYDEDILNGGELRSRFSDAFARC